MADEPQRAKTELIPKTPRWLRLRCWIGGSILLVLLLISPLMRTWYRRHQMIHELFGGYGYHSGGGQASGAASMPFVVEGPQWALSVLESDISPFHSVKSVNLYLPDAGTDLNAKLRLLAQESGLRELQIAFEYDAGVDDSVFQHFKDLRRLSKLSIENIAIPGDGLKHLKQARDLTSLELGLRGPIDGLNVLQDVESLEILKLDFGGSINAEGRSNATSDAADFEHALSHRDHLKVLHLRAWKVGPEAYEALTTNPNLVEVHLEGVQLTPLSVDWLARIPKLQKLYLSPNFWPFEPGMFAALNGSNIEELGLYKIPDHPLIADLFRGVETLPKLKRLKGFLPKNSAEIAFCARCFPELTWLRLRSTKPDRAYRYKGDWEPPLGTSGAMISDNDLRLLTRMQHLEQLELGANPITDEAVELLGQLKSLKEIDVGQTDITAAGRTKLTQLLPDVRLGWTKQER